MIFETMEQTIKKAIYQLYKKLLWVTITGFAITTIIGCLLILYFFITEGGL